MRKSRTVKLEPNEIEEIELGAATVMRSVIACLLGTFVLRMAASVMGSMLQLYFAYINANEYPLSNTLSNIATAIFFLPELVGSPVLGAWSDRYGRKLFIMIGPMSGAIAVQLTALTSHFGVLVFTRLLEGLSTASAIPATLGYLSAVTSKDESLRGRVMGIFEIATIGGTFAGIAIGGRLWDQFGRTAFTLDSALYLVSLAIFFFGIVQLRRRAAARAMRTRADVALELSAAAQVLRETWDSIRRTLSSAKILRFVPAWLAINMILGAWFNSITRQLVATDQRFPDQLLYGVFAGAGSGTEVANYGTLVGGTFGLGVLVWSFSFGKFRRTSVMLISAAGLFVLCAFLFAVNHAVSLSAPAIPIYLGGALLALMVVSGFTPAALTYLADVTEDDPSDRGAIMGLYSVFFGIGQLFGTLIAGPFADARGIDGLISLTALLGIISTMLLVQLHRRETRAALSH